MSEELSQNNEEFQTYHAEQAVAFSRIREMVWSPAEIVNEAHLYDQMMASGEPASAKQALPILAKYSRTMKDILAEIQKVVPPCGTSRRVLYQGALGRQPGPCTRWWERSRWSKTLQRLLDPVSRKATPDCPVPEGPHPAPILQGLERRTRGLSDPDETNLESGGLRIALGLRIEPIRNSEPVASPSKGRGTPTRTPPTSPADCLMTSPAIQPPSRTASSRDPWTTPNSSLPGSGPTPGRRAFPTSVRPEGEHSFRNTTFRNA